MRKARKVQNGRTSLQLHQYADGEGPALLLLHELGASSAMWEGKDLAWEGPLWALDFAGHGSSSWRMGGAYYPELFATDAAAALEAIGPAYLAGAGLGAYVALLLSGGHPEKSPATLLCPGKGLAGGGAVPSVAPHRESYDRLLETHRDSTDPTPPTDPRTVLAEDDIRPQDYTRSFAERCTSIWLAEDGTERPAWWSSLRELPEVRTITTSPTDTAIDLHALRSAALPN